jgi:purine-binding chemotaxis protein CheW
MKCLIFTVQEDFFGVDIYQVVEILNPLKLHRVPEVPEFIAGVINLRGEVIPIISIRKRFGIEDKSDRERILIIMIEDEKIGLLVDDVVEIMDLSEKKISKPSKLFKGFRSEFIGGIAEISGERVIILMNLEKVLTTEEKMTLKRSREKLLDEQQKKSEADKVGTGGKRRR